MAVAVHEVMNRELFTVAPGELGRSVLRDLMSLGITAAPVVDAEKRPIGMVTLRDLLGKEEREVSEAMQPKPLVATLRTTLQDAGRVLAETGFHHLVVVDGQGKAAGIISALDVVRGLLGLPAAHPGAFPHYDARTQATWTDDLSLGFETLEAAPEAGGVLVLLHGGAGIPERVVWAEAAANVRQRLKHMLLGETDRPPMFTDWQARGRLRFRASKVEDTVERQRVLKRVLDRDLS